MHPACPHPFPLEPGHIAARLSPPSSPPLPPPDPTSEVASHSPRRDLVLLRPPLLDSMLVVRFSGFGSSATHRFVSSEGGGEWNEGMFRRSEFRWDGLRAGGLARVGWVVCAGGGRGEKGREARLRSRSIPHYHDQECLATVSPCRGFRPLEGQYSTLIAFVA